MEDLITQVNPSCVVGATISRIQPLSQMSSIDPSSRVVGFARVHQTGTGYVALAAGVIDGGGLQGRDVMLAERLAYDVETAGERRMRRITEATLGLGLGQGRGEGADRVTGPVHRSRPSPRRPIVFVSHFPVPLH